MLSCIANNTKIKFQISKQATVTESLVIIVCRVILLYEARVANSLLGNRKLVVSTAVLDLRQGLTLRHPTLRAFL